MTVFSKRVAADVDNGYHREDTDVFDATLINNIFFGELSTAVGAFMNGFARFTNVTIPKNSTINSAKMVLTASAADSADTVNVRIYMNDSDDAIAPTTKEGFNALVLTTAFTNWYFTTNWVTDTEYDSGDFTNAVQEVVNRLGWASGNAMSVVWHDVTSNDDAERLAYAYTGDNAKCPELVIDYTEPSGQGFTCIF